MQTAKINLAELALDFRRTESLLTIEGLRPAREIFSVVIGSSGDSRLLTRNFEIASRDQAAVQGTVGRTIELLKGSGLQEDLLLAS